MPITKQILQYELLVLCEKQCWSRNKLLITERFSHAVTIDIVIAEIIRTYR